jgi:hypothetical protein
MGEIIDIIFSDQFIPHGFCFMWRPELVWMHVLSDLTIAIAYFSIPITIVILMAKRKKVLPHIWVFRLFAAFIFLCGLTHLVEIVGIWYPLYYLEGIIKVFTAAVSLATAILMFPLIPVILNRFSDDVPDKSPEQPKN